MGLLLYFVVFSVFFSSTRGQGKDDRVDHKGNAFCVAFLQNGLAPPTLKLYILTDEVDTVQVHVSFHNSSASSVVNVTSNSVSVVSIPSSFAVGPSTLSRNAISIQTNDSMQSISVYGQNLRLNSSSIFLALPIREHEGVNRYQYVHFSSQPAQTDYSMFILSNCNDDAVVPSLQSPTDLSGLIPVRDVYRQFADSREYIEDRPTPLRMKEEFESLHFEDASSDITGIKAWASRPFSFISGLTCVSKNCDHFSQQIPPSYTWGYLFTSFPVVDDVSSYQIKVVAVYNGTYLTYYCNDSTNGSILLSDEGYALAFPPHMVCSFSSDRPIGVVQILNQEGVTGGAMVWLPPVRQYLSQVSFPTGILFNGSHTVSREFVWVTVLAEHFDTSLIQLDGLLFEQDTQQWREIKCSSIEVCAYGIAVQMSEGKHTLQHRECQGCLSVMIYGKSDGASYAYSTGYAMDPIGVPVVSFTESLYTGSETVDPNITLSRAGDINVAVDVIVHIIHTDNALPSNGDFTSFNETIRFSAGQREATMSLRVRDDLRVEASENFTLLLMQADPSGNVLFLPMEQATLQIQDNDMLVIGFTVDTVSVSEESETVQLTLRSNIPLQDSGMNIIINTEDGTAVDTFDYTRLNTPMFLRPGDSEWTITATITNDGRLEGTEHFFVSFAVVVTAVEVTIATDRVQVNITDTDRVTIRFMETLITMDEGTVSQIVLNKVGGSDFPVQVMVNTEDNTATGGIDYERLDDLLIEFEAEETEKLINVTALPDSILEIDERFIVRLSSDSTERINFLFGTGAIISIVDDDEVEIGFSREEYPVDENDGVVMIVVEIKQGIANRAFAFHVETFEQQAEEESDFEKLDRDLQFPPFQSSFTFNVTIIDNVIAEAASEGFTIALTNSPTDNLDISIGEFARATVAIKEDDDVLIRMDTVDLFLEGREGGPDLTLRLVKANDIVAIVPVSVFLAVEVDDATEGVDFTIDQVIEFAPDENEQYATIQLLTDSEREATESFFVLLVPDSGPVTVDLNQILTVSILDTDATTVEFSSPTYSATEGESIQLRLSVVGSLNRSIPILVTTSPGSADENDYTLPLDNQMFTITAGMTVYEFSIMTTDDELFENVENFTVSVDISSGNDAVTGPQSTTVVTITDNDAVSATILQDSVEVFENSGNAVVAIQRIGLSQIDISLTLSVQEQSAKGGEDFVFTSGSRIFIPADESSVNISIQIVNDNTVEETRETLLLRLTSTQPRVAIGNRNMTEIFIVDDDVLEVLFNQSTYVVAEEPGAIVGIDIITKGSTEIPLSVMIMTKDGTAKGGEDYVALKESLTFNLSISEYHLSISIMDDLILEGIQDFMICLNTTELELVFIPPEGGQATVEIKDGLTSDVTASIIAVKELVLENELLVLFNISITGQRQKNVFIGFETEEGSATANSDYTPVRTTVVFNEENGHSLTVSVQLMNDDISEVRENFFGVIRSSEPAVTLSSNQSEVIIKDDEGAVLTLQSSSYVAKEGEMFIVRVLRSVDVTEEIDLVVTAIDGTAEVGADIDPVNGSVMIAAGGTSSQLLSLEPFLDGLFERANETFELLISLPSEETGAVIINDRAIVTIQDQDALIFTGANIVTNERNSTADICFSSNIPSAIPIQLQLTYTPSLIDGAEVNVDYNVSQTFVTVPSSLHQPPSFCVSLTVLLDSEQEPDEHLCLMVSTITDGVSFEYNSTDHCPPSSVTITIKDAGVATVPICYLEDSMVVTPFPKPLSPSPAYSYHGSCEHVLVQQCSMEPFFTVNTDHNPNDLAVSRVAVRINSSFVIIDADEFNYTIQNFAMEESISPNSKIFDSVISVTVDDISTIEVSFLQLGIRVLVSSDMINSTLRVVVNATEYLRGTLSGDLCGLCGRLDGVLVYSDQKTRLTSRNTELVEDFARSWFVNPEDQITRNSGRDCGVLGNDSVVGDPLYSVPVHSSNSSLQSVSLCFEVHGAVDKVFNLVSDRCVSVNALYSSMINPNDGNIITSVGVRAVDTSGRCVNVIVSLSEQCLPIINSNAAMFYSQFGVFVRKQGDKVSVSVPNCENEQLVMWMMCRTIGMQRMLDFTIRRGLNLRPTSHGLLGQFWNVPVKLFSYHTELPELIKDDYDPDKLYLVTIEDPISLINKRQFIGELSKRSWDKSLRSCLYVGSSQGGKLSDIPGPKDSVIEGVYSHYAVPGGILSTSFTYSRFDQTIC